MQGQQLSLTSWGVSMGARAAALGAASAAFGGLRGFMAGDKCCKSECNLPAQGQASAHQPCSLSAGQAAGSVAEALWLAVQLTQCCKAMDMLHSFAKGPSGHRLQLQVSCWHLECMTEYSKFAGSCPGTLQPAAHHPPIAFTAYSRELMA